MYYVLRKRYLRKICVISTRHFHPKRQHKPNDKTYEHVGLYIWSIVVHQYTHLCRWLQSRSNMRLYVLICGHGGVGGVVYGRMEIMQYWPLNRYAKLRVAHAPGMPGTVSPPSRLSDPYLHHGTCVTHVPWCMPGSLTSGFLWCGCRGKRSRHSRLMRNPQMSVSGKRPIPHVV